MLRKIWENFGKLKRNFMKNSTKFWKFLMKFWRHWLRNALSNPEDIFGWLVIHCCSRMCMPVTCCNRNFLIVSAWTPHWSIYRNIAVTLWHCLCVTVYFSYTILPQLATLWRLNSNCLITYLITAVISCHSPAVAWHITAEFCPLRT